MRFLSTACTCRAVRVSHTRDVRMKGQCVGNERQRAVCDGDMAGYEQYQIDDI